MQPASQGRTADGGWLKRKNIPPGGQISKFLALAGITVLVLAVASRKTAAKSLLKPGEFKHPPRA
jgi:hypothetical protein